MSPPLGVEVVWEFQELQISRKSSKDENVQGLGMQCSDRRQRSMHAEVNPPCPALLDSVTDSPDQVRVCFVRMAGSSTGSFPRPLKWVLRGGVC